MTQTDVLWAAIALVAAAAQTARNSLQSSLTASLGALGATMVRFLYGLPFGVLFLAIAASLSGTLPVPNAAFVGWTVLGAISQIAATALMLTAMRDRSFVVVTVYTKTELVQAALLGAVLLGDHLSALSLFAVIGASLGVLLASWPKAVKPDAALASFTPALQGVAAGGLFAFAAVGYRGANLALGDIAFPTRAAYTLVWALALQTVLMTGWFAWRDRARLWAVLAAWRPSLLAGFMGAFASFGWFAAFTLTTAANVKMVGLVEVGFAWIVSRRIFGEGLLPREIAGMALIVAAILLTLIG